MANYLDEINGLSSMVADMIDAESAIIIDTFTRNCSVDDGFNKQIAVENDNNSNIITFNCDKYIDNYDLSYTDILVTWKNLTSGEEISRLVESMEDLDNIVSFTCRIPKEITKVASKLEVIVTFVNYTNDEKNVIAYRWSTNPYTELYVGRGIPNKDIDDLETLDDLGQETAVTGVLPHLLDAEEAIELNMFSRNIIIGSGTNKQIGVEGDCYANLITFNVDVGDSDFDIENATALVKWIINGVSGYDILLDKKYWEDGEKLGYSYSWQPKPNIMRNAGKVAFGLCFVLDSLEQANKWNSNPCEELYVGKGILNDIVDGTDGMEGLYYAVPEEEL